MLLTAAPTLSKHGWVYSLLFHMWICLKFPSYAKLNGDFMTYISINKNVSRSS